MWGERSAQAFVGGFWLLLARKGLSWPHPFAIVETDGRGDLAMRLGVWGGKVKEWGM